MLCTLTSSGMEMEKGWDIAQDRIFGKLVQLGEKSQASVITMY